MKQVKKVTYVILAFLTAFLSLTGFAGGIGLLAGLNTPPVEMLNGSFFKNFTIPGLSLFGLVGGSALLAALLLIRKSKFAVLFALVSGFIIIFFEFVEVLVIGSPPGVAQTLQFFYFGLGTLIAIVSIGIWFIDLLSEPNLKLAPTGNR
jgi:hypothetical protein